MMLFSFFYMNMTFVHEEHLFLWNSAVRDKSASTMINHGDQFNLKVACQLCAHTEVPTLL